MGSVGSAIDVDRPNELAVDRLDGDSLAAILSSLDAFSLAMALGVSQLWRATASNEDLWAAACRARWQLPAPRDGRMPGRPPHEMVGCSSTGQPRRCKSWPEAYRVFHRLKRPPLLHDRVAYATGMQDFVGCWLLVAHQPACKLSLALHGGEHAHKVLRARVLVQNLREDPVSLSDGCLQMTYRGIGRPFAVRVAAAEVVASSEQGKRPWALADEPKLPLTPSPSLPPLPPPTTTTTTTHPPLPGWAPCTAALALPSPLLLAPLEFALLDCELAALAGMAHEPDVLEACDTLQLRLSVPGVPARVERGAAERSAERSVVVACPFLQETLFEHYQQVNSGFWVHDAELDRDR